MAVSQYFGRGRGSSREAASRAGSRLVAKGAFSHGTLSVMPTDGKNFLQSVLLAVVAALGVSVAAAWRTVLEACGSGMAAVSTGAAKAVVIDEFSISATFAGLLSSSETFATVCLAILGADFLTTRSCERLACRAI